MKLKGTLFDTNGHPYSVDNVDIYVGEMKDRLLIEIYRSTIYQHELTLEMESLVKQGLLLAENVQTYSSEFTENAIASMRDEVSERFDNEYHDEVIKSIDLSFLKNRTQGI